MAKVGKEDANLHHKMMIDDVFQKRLHGKTLYLSVIPEALAKSIPKAPTTKTTNTCISTIRSYQLNLFLDLLASVVLYMKYNS